MQGPGRMRGHQVCRVFSSEGNPLRSELLYGALGHRQLNGKF